MSTALTQMFIQPYGAQQAPTARRVDAERETGCEAKSCHSSVGEQQDTVLPICWAERKQAQKDTCDSPLTQKPELWLHCLWVEGLT